MTCYTYAPLDESNNEIRLLIIWHDEWEASLQCSIRVVSLNDAPVYRTLSYVWGDPGPQTDIFIDDCTISVNSNLADAIRRLRASISDHERLEIWIDAVCVDQKNIPERGHSVTLMRKIYSQCLEVTVWLGETDRHKPTLECASSINSLRDKNLNDIHESGCECLNESWSRLPDMGSTHLLPSHIKPALRVLHRFATARNCDDLQLCRVFSDVDDMTAFRSFFHFLDGNPWFRRIWTVQEVLLPPSVQMRIGSSTFSFVSISSFINVLGNHLKDGCCTTLAYMCSMDWNAFGYCSEINSARSVWHAGIPFVNLFAYRALFMGRKASLDVDLIYGVLGLFQSDITPRYDWSVEDVYRDVSRKFLQAPAVCDCYGFAAFGLTATKTRYAHLPSWVMDWTSLETQSAVDNGLQLMQLQLCPNHLPTLRTEFASQYSFAGDMLVLSGYVLDRVVTIGDACSSFTPEDHTLTDRYMESVHEWRRLVLGRHKPDALYTLPKGYPSPGRDWATVWCRSLCQGRRLDRANDDNNMSVLTDEEIDIIQADSRFDSSNVFRLQWEPQYLSNPNARQASQALARMLRPDLYMQALTAATILLHDQRMFLSQHDYLGIGNRHITQGDLIFLSETCGRPLVLRPVHDCISRLGRQTYTIVGSCYLDGLMEGPSEPMKVNFEEFWIE